MVRARAPKPSSVEDEPAAKIQKLSTSQSVNQSKSVAKNKVTLDLCTIPTQSGNVLCCGQNEVGQLGLGDSVSEKTRPALLADAIDAVQISAGGMHSLYLDKSGIIHSFGCNDEGALGRDTTEEGSEYTPSSIDLPGKCVQISAGDSHSACLLDDGRAFAWGSFRDSHGTMGLTLEGNKRFPVEVVPNLKFVNIVSGADHLVLLSQAGKVYTIGCAEQGQLGRVSARSSGGESRRGKTQLLMPGMVSFKKGKGVFDAIWASTYCTYVRDHYTGEIFAFGLNNYNQLGLKKNSDPMFVPKLTHFTNVKSITGGQHHTLVLTNDNKCHAIGRKEYGRLGLGVLTEDVEVLTPVKKLADKTIKEISCGESCSFAVTDDGLVYAWGMGTNSQLGTGSEDDAIEPVLLTGVQVKDKNVLTVSSGGQHSVFVVSTIAPKPVKNGIAKPAPKEVPVVKATKIDDVSTTDDQKVDAKIVVAPAPAAATKKNNKRK